MFLEGQLKPRESRLHGRRWENCDQMPSARENEIQFEEERGSQYELKSGESDKCQEKWGKRGTQLT